jgi:hypothetical protein
VRVNTIKSIENVSLTCSEVCVIVQPNARGLSTINAKCMALSHSKGSFTPCFSLCCRFFVCIQSISTQQQCKKSLLSQILLESTGLHRIVFTVLVYSVCGQRMCMRSISTNSSHSACTNHCTVVAHTNNVATLLLLSLLLLR